MASAGKIKFGEAVQRLEEIVKKLEDDEIALEESSALFEEGTKLAKFCSERLNETEQRIEKLVKDSTGKIATSATDDDTNE